MHILHLEDEPWDSGMAHYALTLAAEQARRGHHVEFWGRAGSPVLAAGPSLGLCVRGLAGAKGWAAGRGQAAALAPQVINAHTGATHALALHLAAGRPCAVVRTRGDARPARSNLLTRFVASRTAAFIAANTALATSLKAAFPTAKVAHVPQGLAGPAHVPPLPGAPVVGMLARFDPVKGHEVLLEAIAKLKEKLPGPGAGLPALRVRCAGEGRLLPGLRRQLVSAGLEGVVDICGRVPDAWLFMAACRVAVAPSLGSEAVSRAALEWMASGRAVVASRVGGLSDLIEDGVTGLLVEPGDPVALAEALYGLLLDPVRAAEMGAAARRRWEKAFGLETFYEATQRVYDETARNLPS